MTELSTNVLSHTILFVDGSTMEITEKAYSGIMSLSLKPEAKMARLNGQLIALSSISKILTKQEYYEQYPDKRPAPKIPHISELKEVSWGEIVKENFPNYTNEKKGRALEMMIKGLQRFINKEEKVGKGIPTAKTLLKQMQLRQTSYVSQTKPS